MELLWKFLTALIPPLIVFVVSVYYNRKQARRDEAAHEREVSRSESEAVQVALLLATAKLSYALAMAAKRGTPNGEVEEGIEQYKEAITAFKAFERKLVVKTSTEK